ncbi:MAG: GntR family transcriptional regulator [Candidatus Aminicenantes bacterium]|nr:GntR family transcriptional regulator [Candidatus Aminicenantes bacterium]
MIKWRIDKSNKVPLYLQLKDLIKYYISTGAIQDNNQLPGVNTLGGELGVNFETVRKAYKELEKEGFISMERGRGTFVTLHRATIPKINPDVYHEADPKETVKYGIQRLLRSGVDLPEVKKIVAGLMKEMEKEGAQQTVVFTECNLYQIKEISKILKGYLNLGVKPVLIQNLREEVEKILAGPEKLLAVITTGFHINEIRKILEGIPVSMHVLITSMSSETRKMLMSQSRDSKIGFICRDRVSISFWEELIKDELGRGIKLSCCILEEEAKVEEILSSVNVLLVSPPVYKALKKKAPVDFPVLNVFDRVDAMSLRVIKERISEVI